MSTDRERAKWYDFQRACEAIREMITASAERLSSPWQSSRVKYVELRVDIRNGKCSIKDRYGEVISIEELKRIFELLKGEKTTI